MNKKGMFITFEGSDGSGKTTQLEILKQRLPEKVGDTNVVFTREPGGTPIASSIRDLLLNARSTGPEPMCELLMFEAARAELVGKVIKPALEAGKIVICDRFTHSTMAYQGGGNGIARHLIKTLNMCATDGIVPDLTVWLQTPPINALARATDPNRFKEKGAAFAERVYNEYARMAKDDNRIVAIPHASIEETSEAVWETIMDTLGRLWK
jgi:dTMP kinase